MGAIWHRWKFSNEYVLINAAAAAFTNEWQARSQVISVVLYTTTSVQSKSHAFQELFPEIYSNTSETNSIYKAVEFTAFLLRYLII